jgi:RNA polymerase sigma factor (sigma-70 family)
MYGSTPAPEQVRRERLGTLATRLYREHHDHLLRIARRNAANPEDAAEAVQFAFLALLDKYDPDSGAPPLAWLSLVTKREAWAKQRREHLDRRTGQEAGPDPEEPGFSVESVRATTAGPEESLERAERVVEARQRLTALKPAERRTLGLIGAGYSYREIGEITGFSYTKTNRSAAEGRAALRAGQPA